MKAGATVEAKTKSGQTSALPAGLTVAGVAHRYASAEGDVSALDEVSIELTRGQVGVLIGPSGCGKTTLLNLVAGFLAPETGLIEVNGLRVEGPSPRRTVVFQEHGLFDWMTAAGNINAGLHSTKLSRAERKQRVAELLEMVNLSDFANHYPSQLSGGMRQRIGLARALGPRPDVLLLDEPFAALDSLTREKLQDDLRAIRDRTQMTCLLVTHSIEEAAYLGDVVFVMTPSPGRVMARWTHSSSGHFSRTDEAFSDATRELRLLVEASQRESSNPSQPQTRRK